jgi:hypothetical protein
MLASLSYSGEHFLQKFTRALVVERCHIETLSIPNSSGIPEGENTIYSNRIIT